MNKRLKALEKLTMEYIKMKKMPYPEGVNAELIDQIQSLHDLNNLISRLESRVSKISGKLRELDRIAFQESKKQKTGNTSGNSPALSNIILFPHSDKYLKNRSTMNFPNSGINRLAGSVPILALPGMKIPPGIPDFRPYLQRDGLILLGWDKRESEKGAFYTAYWITSTGIPRFYASKPLPETDFPAAMPHHKSYAAEDGIEFYGQDPPAYLVHVAPELFKSSPIHKEVREVHIKLLELEGVNVDFNYQFLLTNEKKPKKKRFYSRKPDRAGA